MSHFQAVISGRERTHPSTSFERINSMNQGEDFVRQPVVLREEKEGEGCDCLIETYHSDHQKHGFCPLASNSCTRHKKDTAMAFTKTLTGKYVPSSSLVTNILDWLTPIDRDDIRERFTSNHRLSKFWIDCTLLSHQTGFVIVRTCARDDPVIPSTENLCAGDEMLLKRLSVEKVLDKIEFDQKEPEILDRRALHGED